MVIHQLMVITEKVVAYKRHLDVVQITLNLLMDQILKVLSLYLLFAYKITRKELQVAVANILRTNVAQITSHQREVTIKRVAVVNTARTVVVRIKAHQLLVQIMKDVLVIRSSSDAVLMVQRQQRDLVNKVCLTY